MELPSSSPSISVLNIAETTLAVSMSEHTTVYNSISLTATAVVTTETAMFTTAAIIGTVVPAFIIMVFGIITIVIIFFMVQKHKRTKLAPLETLHWQKSENNYMVRNEFIPDGAVVSTTSSTIASDSTAVSIHDPPYMEARSEYLPTHLEPTIRLYADLHHSTNPPAPPLPVEPVQYATISEQTDNTVTTQSEEKKEDSLDADDSTNPAAPPPAVEPGGAPDPSQQEPVYADLPHSTTGRPAPPPPVEQTDNTETTQSKELHYAQVHHSTNPPAPPLPVEPVQYAAVKKPQTDYTVTAQTEANTKPIQYEMNCDNKHPLSCEGSSSGYNSASALSGDHVTMASNSTGNNKKVFLQSKPYRPDNSKYADAGLLYSDKQDADGQVSWSANPSMDVTSNYSPSEHVVPSATVNANTTPVVQTRGGNLPSGNGDSQTGSVQQFQCQLNASNDDLLVEELCLSEDEETLLSATLSIATSEHTSLGMEFRSRMEQDDSSVAQASQLLVTARKSAEMDEKHELVVGLSGTIPKNEDLQSTESLSLFDAPLTMEQASVSKQPHEVQWMYKSEVSPLPEHNIDTTDVPDFYSVDYELMSSSSFDEYDDHDALQPAFTVASNASFEGTNELEEAPTLLNKKTSMDECTSFGCRLSEEGEAYKKNDNNSSPLCDDSLTPPNSGHLSSLSPSVFSSSSLLDSHLSNDESPAVKSDEVSPNVECPSVATRISAPKKAFAFGRLKTSLQSTFFSHTSSSIIAGIIAGKSVTEKLQSLKLSFSKMLTDIRNIEKRMFGWYPFFMYNWRHEHLHRDHVVFNTYHLENYYQFGNKEIKCLIEAYKLERDQFMESTTVLEFQQAVSTTAEFAVPEEKECIKIEVSRNWAKAKKLKDVMSLAQRVFGDYYESFIGFNVVPRMGSFIISWLFPKRLKVELQELNAAVFQQEDVHKVMVGDFTAFTHESNCDMYDDLFKIVSVPTLSLFKPTTEPDGEVSFSQCYGSRFACLNYSSTPLEHSSTLLPFYSPPSLTVKDLVKVCKNVDDWYMLGLHLRLSVKQLDHIRRKYSHLGTEPMKRMMFEVWLKSTPGASWTDLITALREIGEDYVACMIDVHKISAIRPYCWENPFSFEDDVEYLMNREKSFRCTILSLLNTIGSCQKVTCRVRHCWSSHEVLKVAYHHKWPFKDEGTTDENTQSQNCSHDMCSSCEVMPINENASRNYYWSTQYYAYYLVKESKYECTETVNRKVTQLNAPLDTTEEYSAKEDNAFCYLSNNLFKNTNKSDLLYAAMLIGAATFIRDMEFQFVQVTETQSNISGVISAMWSYSMIPTVNSFTDQLAGGGLFQLIC